MTSVTHCSNGNETVLKYLKYLKNTIITELSLNNNTLIRYSILQINIILQLSPFLSPLLKSAVGSKPYNTVHVLGSILLPVSQASMTGSPLEGGFLQARGNYFGKGFKLEVTGSLSVGTEVLYSLYSELSGWVDISAC